MEKKILAQVNEAIKKSIVEVLTKYRGPLAELTERVILANEDELFNLINKEYKNLIDGGEFRKQLKIALNAKLAKTLVSRMGGELESQINKLKSDPVTRSKITIAIDNVISEINNK